MSKVITFSRTFPKGHPRQGQSTFFVEKVLHGLRDININIGHYKKKVPLNFLQSLTLHTPPPEKKFTTIRAGKRFKTGEKFSPRVWSNKPYNSKQITFFDDILIVKTWDFKIEVDEDYLCVLIDGHAFYEKNKRFETQPEALETMAANDGLALQDFKDWFKWGQPFDGQIICWNQNINYSG